MWDLFTIRLTKLVRRLGKDIHRMLTTINNSSSTKEQLTDVAKEIKRNMELLHRQLLKLEDLLEEECTDSESVEEAIQE